MLESRCKSCEFGGEMIGMKSSFYKFKKAIKKQNDRIIDINYNKGDNGCRMTEWNNKENICLENNFSEFSLLIV